MSAKRRINSDLFSQPELIYEGIYLYRIGNVRIANFIGSTYFYNTTTAYIPSGDRPSISAYTSLFIVPSGSTIWSITELRVAPEGTFNTGTPGQSAHSSARIRGTVVWWV